ncbi:MAG: hypothetical protein H3C43_07265 [Leptonema sp. (in: Bacteria)]|nr:hypothetical protein [Leptonema sp. (in: bacteria)]
MIIEQLRNLTVKPNTFTGYFFVPDSTKIVNNLDKGGLFHLSFKSTDSKSYRTLFLKSEKDQSLKIGFVTIEDVNQKQDQIRTFFDEILLRNNFEIQPLRNEIQHFAEANKLIISSALLSCLSEQQEEDSDIALFDVLMGGLPPLVMIEDGRFHFPVRSGIPLGVNDLLIKSQILEVPINSVFYLHTQLNQNYELRQLHSLLQDIDTQKLPDDILLFGLQLASIEN